MAEASDISAVSSDISPRASDSAHDDGKPWTIRGVPPEARNAAIQAAKRANLNIGEWLDGAVRTAIRSERAEKREVAKVGAAPLVLCPIDDVQAAADVAEQISRATGKPVSRRLARAIQRQLLANLGG